MPKLNEEAPPALAVVRSDRAPVLEPPQESAVVRWGRALVMETHGWSPLPGVMCIPEWEFRDPAGLRTHGAS
ncbi:MAG TPA: hypothetical protein VLR91_06040 [Thermodesulfobacteriota bacterium]|nr:hypothetical protein [Thermodesulfobacteriota bacterium]